MQPSSPQQRFKILVPGNLRYVFAVMVTLLVLNFLLRVAFLMYNTAQVKAMEWGEIWVAFLIGLRFDIATIFLFNGLLFVLLAAPLSINRMRITYRIANIFILLVNLPILLVNAIDVVYFSFAEKRLTHELYTTKGGDLLNFNFDVLKDWWYLFLGFFALVAIMVKLLSIFANRNLSRLRHHGFSPIARYWALAGMVALLIFIGARGGIQRQPLNSAMAFIDPNLFVGKAGLNSAYTIISSIGFSREDSLRYLPSADAKAITRRLIHNDFDGPFVSDRYPLVRKAQFDGPELRHNVVILIVESFNAAQIGCLNGAPAGKSLTPNMDSLARHGLLLTHYYSNASRSVESLPAILNSLPDVFRRPAISTPYLYSTTWGIGNILGNRGYETAFFCGGPNGTLGFDRYSEVCGLEHYYGKNEYPFGERDYDGLWGCYDEPFLQWVGKMQDSLPKPFLSVWFSISNHHPFVLPKEGVEEIARLDATDMEKTHAYTDRAIGNYFKTVSQMPWFEETYFIITGDHCFHEMSHPEYNSMDYFHVPFLLLGPGIEPGVDHRPANHLNVVPTLIDLLRLDTYHASLGVSLFSCENRPFVINNQMGLFTLADSSHAYTTNFGEFHKLLKMEGNDWREVQLRSARDEARATQLDQELKGVFQTIHNARISNTLMGEEYMK